MHCRVGRRYHSRQTEDVASTHHNRHYLPEAIPHFTPPEINEIMDSIRVASHSNSNLMSGCADFLYMMLTLEEEGVLTSDLLSSKPLDGGDIGTATENDEWLVGAGRKRMDASHSIMTRDVLVAAAFHYCDCVRSRQAGVYNYAQLAMEASLDKRVWEELDKRKQLWLPPTKDENGDVDASRSEDNKPIDACTENGVITSGETPVECYGDESQKIAAGAARLKRAEIMSTVVNANGSKFSRGTKNQSNSDAEILRSFLVSLSEDWRALVIRSAACLYRLKGIEPSNGGGKGESLVLSTDAIRTAREAFHIYAPLAQRLGMQRLKREIEGTAFRILYPRQYSVASSLYDIDEMREMVQVLSTRIEQLLRSDPVFVDQIEELTVSSRVKEPYSLWRKMLKFRYERRKSAMDAKDKATDNIATADKQLDNSTALSLKWVPDAIALRVVLSARRLSSLEDEESVRTREKMLCYYALQLISDVWPASEYNQAKDYIKFPKPNGYQSLHYTASLMVAGQDWPFEVQIRSEEMHRIAEFGVAAHWDYKQALPESSGTSSGMLALPSAGNFTRILADIQPVAIDVNISDVSGGSSARVAQKGSRIASYIDALSTSRETIVQNNRFIFLSSTNSALDGRIVSIDPSVSNVAAILEKYGATIDEGTLDDISEGTLEIYRNGLQMQSDCDEELSNGDVLTLPRAILDKLSF